MTYRAHCIGRRHRRPQVENARELRWLRSMCESGVEYREHPGDHRFGFDPAFGPDAAVIVTVWDDQLLAPPTWIYPSRDR